jgi:DNA-binding MarR family transcriptional regulator
VLEFLRRAWNGRAGMKKIKLSGKEIAVVRAINFATGTLGSEIFDRTRIEIGELTGIINGLMDVGFLECSPYSENVTEESVMKVNIEVNPGYAHELKAALIIHS